MAYGYSTGVGAQAQTANPAMGTTIQTAPTPAPAIQARRFGGGFAFVIVMFILLIIVGATIAY